MAVVAAASEGQGTYARILPNTASPISRLC